MRYQNEHNLFLHILVFVFVLFTGDTISKETGVYLVRAFCDSFFISGFFISMCIASANPHESGAKAVYIFYAIYLSIVFIIHLIYS